MTTYDDREDQLCIDLEMLYSQLAYTRQTKMREGEVTLRALCHNAGYKIDEHRLDRLARQHYPPPADDYYSVAPEHLETSYRRAWDDARGNDRRAALARRWLASLSPRQCEALGVDKKATIMRYLYSLPDAPSTTARE